MLPTGEAYLPTRALYPTKYIWHINEDGSYSSLVSGLSPSWLYAAITPSGLLYADANGEASGVYAIDRQTGVTTPLISGGPGPGGIGGYSDMATTSDGTLYVIGLFAPGPGLFRISSGTSTLLVPLPNPFYGLCRGPSDVLFGATYLGEGEAANGQIWKLDVTSGTATLFASNFGQTVGVAYDLSHDRFYVIDQGGEVWVIVHTDTPVNARSWGGVKAQYR